MTLTLMDYEKNKVSFDIELRIIEEIKIIILSGDEVAKVRYTNGNEATFDSSYNRIMSFYDGEYTLYNKEKGINHLENGFFTKRKDTYEFMYQV